MFGGHAAFERRGAKLRVDQPVLQPPQGRLRFQASESARPLARGVGLGRREQVAKLPIGFHRCAELAELIFDFRNRAAECRVAGVRVQERPKLGQVAADLRFQGGQPARWRP